MNYEWDKLQLGKPELNSSQNFFGDRHVFHEKESIKLRDARLVKRHEQQQQQEQKDIENNKLTSGLKYTDSADSASEINPMDQGNDKENVSSNNGSNNQATAAIPIVEKQPKPAPAKKPTVLTSLLKKSVSVAPSSSSAQVDKKLLLGSSNTDAKSGAMNGDAALKQINGIQSGKRQFEVAEAQKKRKEQLVQKYKDQEDKQMKSNFHANPAPKYKRQVQKQISLPQICMTKKVSKENVVPSCGDPERLKYLNEKKKMLLASKYEETHVQFKAKPAAVLKKEPFQPVHNVKVADPKPFKLHLTDRLLMRSEFDKKIIEAISVRQKQEEVRKRQQDFDDRKLQRQKTEFRARANPFRNR